MPERSSAPARPSAVELRDIALAAAETARAVLTAGQASRQPLQKGAAGDVVTVVDRQVEERLREFLGAARPDDKIVGEELPDTGAATTGIEWYLDPIDGTTNFVVGLDLYCTSVAAYDAINDVWLAGAVSLPTRGISYVAAAGHGAVRIDDNVEARLHATIPAGAPRLLGVGVSYDAATRRRQLAEISDHMEDFDDLRSLGTAAYALCLVGDGTLAAFIETDLYVYDWAAGALIAAEAGATVTRPGMARGAVSAFGARSEEKPAVAAGSRR